ncbi:hemolysin III family protein [Endothiovibrio diazotrophicus]
MSRAERLNTLTHLLGAVLALAGSIVLVVVAVRDGDPWKVASVSVYGSTLVFLYGVSTLYHAASGSPKETLRKLDHLGIYLLIAGSYTPFCVVTLRGTPGWTLLGMVWGLAVLGSLQELRPHSGPRILPVVVYVVMGWAALAALDPLLIALGTRGFAWLAIGGLFYTIGVVFYALDRRIPHGHAIWHLFVVAGSATQYAVVLRHVL